MAWTPSCWLAIHCPPTRGSASQCCMAPGTCRPTGRTDPPGSARRHCAQARPTAFALTGAWPARWHAPPTAGPSCAEASRTQSIRCQPISRRPSRGLCCLHRAGLTTCVMFSLHYNLSCFHFPFWFLPGYFWCSESYELYMCMVCPLTSWMFWSEFHLLTFLADNVHTFLFVSGPHPALTSHSTVWQHLWKPC